MIKKSKVIINWKKCWSKMIKELKKLNINHQNNPKKSNPKNKNLKNHQNQKKKTKMMIYNLLEEK